MTALTSVRLTAALHKERLVAILRGPDPHAVVQAGRVLVEGGGRILEVSLSSASALSSLEDLAKALADSDALLGAGTVIAAGDAARCRDAGAVFAVTPALGPGVQESVERGAVKVFPASVFGPTYLTALAAPFPGIPLVAVGGVAAAEVRTYLDAGALAVGVASPLLGDAAAGGDLDALRSRAAEFLTHVRVCRG